MAEQQRLVALLNRAWEHITCEDEKQGPSLGDVVWCIDHLRREQWCEACAVRADIEDTLNAVAIADATPSNPEIGHAPQAASKRSTSTAGDAA